MAFQSPPRRLRRALLVAVLLAAHAATGPAGARAQFQKMEDCLSGSVDPAKEREKFTAASPYCEYQSYGAIVSQASSEAEPLCAAQCTKTRSVFPNGTETYVDQACLAQCRPRERVRIEKETLNTCLGDLEGRLAANEQVLARARTSSKREHDRVDLGNLANRDEKLAYYSQGNILCRATVATIAMGKMDGSAQLAKDAIDGLSAPGSGAKAFEHMQRLEGGFQRVDEIMSKLDPRASAKWNWSPSTTRKPPPTVRSRSGGADSGSGVPGEVGNLDFPSVDAAYGTIKPGDRFTVQGSHQYVAIAAGSDPCTQGLCGPGQLSPAARANAQASECDSGILVVIPNLVDRYWCAPKVGLGASSGSASPGNPVPGTSAGPEAGPVEGGRETFFKTLTDEDLTGQVEGRAGGKKGQTSLAAIPGFKTRDCRYQDCGPGSGGSASAASPAATARGASGGPGGAASASAPGGRSASSVMPGNWADVISGGPAAQSPEEEFEDEPEGEDEPRALERASRRKAARLLALAQSALGQREWAKALDHLTQALELNPRDEEARTLRSVLYNLLKRYIEAEQDARAALELNPKNVKALVSLAWALLRQGRWREAAEAASAAIALDPDNAFAYRIRAEAREALGDDAGKLEDLKRAAALDARFKAVYEAVKRGGRIQDDQTDPARYFLEAAQRPRASPLSPLALAALALAGVGFAGGLLWRRAKAARRAAPMGAQAPAPAAAMPDSGAPRFVGRYEVLRPLGAGGRLFVAKDPSTGRAVALRRTRVPEAGRREGLRAAQRWQALAHPASVRVLDAIVEGRDLWLAVDWVEGESMEEALARSGRLSFEQAAGRLGPVCHAIQSAHEKGLFHGDLRPSKLLVAKDGRSLVTSFLLPGEPGADAASAQADVFMLATCLKQALAGAPPEAEALLTKALHPDPRQRFQTPEELSSALRQAASGPPEPKSGPPSPGSGPPASGAAPRAPRPAASSRASDSAASEPARPAPAEPAQRPPLGPAGAGVAQAGAPSWGSQAAQAAQDNPPDPWNDPQKPAG